MIVLMTSKNINILIGYVILHNRKLFNDEENEIRKNIVIGHHYEII